MCGLDDANFSSLPALLLAEAGSLPVNDVTVRLYGDEQVVPTSFRVGAAVAVALGTSALAAVQLHYSNSGQTQDIAINFTDALTEFRSERYLRVNGGAPPDLWDPIAGAYGCGDVRSVRIHTNFPHPRDGILRLLSCESERAAVADALKSWSADAFEAKASELGLVVAMIRSFKEWNHTEQAAFTARQPLIAIDRVRDSLRRALPLTKRPLEGSRVVEMTRIILVRVLSSGTHYLRCQRKENKDHCHRAGSYTSKNAPSFGAVG